MRLLLSGEELIYSAVFRILHPAFILPQRTQLPGVGFAQGDDRRIRGRGDGADRQRRIKGKKVNTLQAGGVGVILLVDLAQNGFLFSLKLS